MNNPSPEDLALLRNLKAQQRWYQYHGQDAKCPCFICEARYTCRSAWDIYNDEESCLEDK